MNIKYIFRSIIYKLYIQGVHNKLAPVTFWITLAQGRSQDVSLRGSVCERSEPATQGRFWASEASPLRPPQAKDFKV